MNYETIEYGTNTSEAEKYDRDFIVHISIFK